MINLLPCFIGNDVPMSFIDTQALIPVETAGGAQAITNHMALATVAGNIMMITKKKKEL